MISLNKILRNGKAFFLAYDQGLEHGPEDFNDKNVNPEYIIDIAKRGKFNALIAQKGIAEKYHSLIKKKNVRLIIKLNGKTNLVQGDFISRQLCSVNEAVKLGAVAVGYTIYLGSKYESVMLKEFENIQREAHSRGIPVIAWVYPPKKLSEKKSKEFMPYAARTGLEIGADIIKIKYSGNPKELEWAVKSAGKTKVVIAGGVKKDENAFLEQAKEIMSSGAVGMAVGRNVWQNRNPLKISEKIRRIIFK